MDDIKMTLGSIDPSWREWEKRIDNDPCDAWPIETVGANVMILHKRYDAHGVHCGTSFTSIGRAEWLTDDAKRYIAAPSSRANYIFASGDADFLADNGDRRFLILDNKNRSHTGPTIGELIQSGHITEYKIAPPLADVRDIDPFYRSANCDHDWQRGAEGAFTGLFEHCTKCGDER